MALQDIWPEATCFGCGPGNPHGLHIKSDWSEDRTEVVCVFHPQPYHNSGFDNIMYGGLVASLCDCHSIWTAIAWAYRDEGREFGGDPKIAYVTGNLNVSYLAPTPLDRPVILRARVEAVAGRKSTVHCDVYVDDKQTAEAKILAIRVAVDKSIGAS